MSVKVMLCNTVGKHTLSVIDARMDRLMQPVPLSIESTLDLSGCVRLPRMNLSLTGVSQCRYVLRI